MLAAALMRPAYEYTLEELLTIAATGRGSTQRQLERLLEAGILREERRRGRQRRIAANYRYFLYPELKSIARKSFGLTVPLTDALQPFCKYIDEAFVLGPAAPGADGNQDVELVVLGAVCKTSLQPALRRIEQDQGRRIRLRVYSSRDWLELLACDPVTAAAARRAEKLTLGKSEHVAADAGTSRGLAGEATIAAGFTASLLGVRPRE